MTAEVARVLALSLMPLYTSKIVTVLGGLVKTASTLTKDGKPLRMPVPFGQHAQPMQVKYDSLIPNSRERAIIYFEGNDSDITTFHNNKSKIRSNVRLICWYNSDSFEILNEGSVQTSLLSSILALLPNAARISTDILGMDIQPGRVYDSAAKLFSQYSYREEVGQYLSDPYYALGIDIQVTYQLNHNCHARITPIDTACC